MEFSISATATISPVSPCYWYIHDDGYIHANGTSMSTPALTIDYRTAFY